MNRTATLAISLPALTLLTLPAQAEPIYMFHQGSGSGTIGGLTFSDAEFTITTLADFDNIIPFSNGLRLINESATITITGVGTFDFITETQNYVNHAFGTVGFTRLTQGDLFQSPADGALLTWDMTTEIEPITGLGFHQQWAIEPVHTTGGVLRFDFNMTEASFSASFDNIPTPATLTILSLSALATTRRRRS